MCIIAMHHVIIIQIVSYAFKNFVTSYFNISVIKP